MIKLLRDFSAVHALRWPILAPVCQASGAALYLTAASEPSVFIILPALILSLVLWLAMRKARPGGPELIALLIFMFSLGAATAKLKSEIVASPRISERSAPRRLEGVLESLDRSDTGIRLKIHVSSISGLTRGETPLRVRLTQRELTELLPGRPVSCLAILSPPPSPVMPGDYDFARQAYFERLGGVGFVLGSCRPAANDTTGRNWRGEVFDRLNAVRRKIALHVAGAGSDIGGGIAAAMTSGDRSLLDPASVEALRRAGLAHLLAISGLHMGLAGGIFYLIARYAWSAIEPLSLRAPAPKVAATAAIIACSGYLLLSGAGTATQRAYIMTVVALGAILADRSAVTMRSLTIAMILVTLVQPESVTSPGYQMSFAATAALVSLYEIWPRQLSQRRRLVTRLASWTSSLIATSVTASLATAPFAAYHFGRVALMSIPANLAAMPLVSFWTTPSAALALLATPFGLERPFLKSMSVSLDTVVAIAARAAESAPDSDPFWMPDAVFLSLLAGLCLFVILRGWFKLTSVFPLLAALLVWNATPPLKSVRTPKGTLYINTEQGWYRAGKPSAAPGNREMTPLSLKEVLRGEICSNSTCEPALTDADYAIRITSSDASGEKKAADVIHSDDPETVLFSLGPSSSNDCDTGIFVRAQGSRLSTQRFRASASQHRPWRDIRNIGEATAPCAEYGD